LREERRTHRKNKKLSEIAKENIIDTEKVINEYIKWVKEDFSDTIERYAFPCNEMIEIIYPKHFQKVLLS